MKDSFFDEDKLKSLNFPTPFFVFSPKALIANVEMYQKSLPPQTEICYAMKSNSELPVLKTLKDKGVSFEVASTYELDILKNLQVPAAKIVYGTAVKPDKQIQDFANYGVDRYAFDTDTELVKIAKHKPHARVFVRVLVDDGSDSVFHMSEKFGVALKDGVSLLLKAKQMGLVPYGISFNVGSQARSEYAWARGITDVIHAMTWLKEQGLQIQMINLGGGFPYSYLDNDNIPSLSNIAKHIIESATKVPYPVSYIAEPGRGLVANTYVLILSVIGKNKRANGHWLFVDAGVYNALLEAMAYQGSIRYRIKPLGTYPSDKKESFILTGPTGDNLDILDNEAVLPADIAVGDKLVVYDTGAYTFTLITPFNGFPKPPVHLLT